MNRRAFIGRIMVAGATMISARAATASQTAGGEEPQVHHVEIRRFKFVPETLSVRQGDTIVWTNHDIAPHTATARDKSWDSGRLKRGATFTATVSEDFDGPYFCRFHPMMKAAIKIVP